MVGIVEGQCVNHRCTDDSAAGPDVLRSYVLMAGA